MPKIIFTSGIDPEYDDIPEVRCEFPQRYLRTVEEALDDWVIYYEPRKNGGRLSYYASAKVSRIEPHPSKPNSYYMYVSDYLDFTNPIPFRRGEFFYERRMKQADGNPNLGLLQWAVRRLAEDEFGQILTEGFGNPLPTFTQNSQTITEPAAIFNRPTVESLVTRPFRDQAFSKTIHSSYNETCALSGLRLHNGDNRYEVDAAHIRAVEDNGPDSARNGLALGKTLHWLFDRGVISLEDDGKILTAEKLLPLKVKSLINEDGYATLPDSPILRPHPQFLRFHRENRFLG